VGAGLDAEAVCRWVALKIDALVAYWEGRIDTARVIQALRPLSSAPYRSALRRACATLPSAGSQRRRRTSLMRVWYPVADAVKDSARLCTRNPA
jgi:hypothetical protein